MSCRFAFAVRVVVVAASAAVFGCRPSLRITYDITGEAEPSYTAEGNPRVGFFQGDGEWNLVVVARVFGDGDTEPRKVRREYHVSGGGIRVHLKDFQEEGSTAPSDARADARADARGRYEFSFAIRGAGISLPRGVVVVDRSPPRFLLQTMARVGAGGDEPIAVEREVGETEVCYVRQEHVRVRVKDASPCEVEVDGRRVFVDQDGVIDVGVAGSLDSAMRLRATDRAGNVRDVRLTLVRDREEPRFELPEALDAVLHARSAREGTRSLEFSTTDDVGVASVSLHVNGAEVPLSPLTEGDAPPSPERSRWRATLSLREGDNQLVFRAEDRVGSVTEVVKTVDFDPSRKRVAWTVVGSDEPLYTNDAGITVAEFRSGGGFEVVAVARRTEQRTGVTEEVPRRYVSRGENVIVSLRDFLPAEESAQPGRYVVTFSSGDADSQAEPPAATVVLDTVAPVIDVGPEKSLGVHRAVATHPGANSTEPKVLDVVALDENFTLRVRDEWPGTRLLLDGNPLEDPDLDGVYWVAAREAVLRAVADDAAGNQTSLVLRVQRDRAPPRLEFVNFSAEDATARDLQLYLRADDDTSVERLVLTHNGHEVQTQPYQDGASGDGASGDRDYRRAEVRLEPGENELRAIAEDRGGRVTTLVRTVSWAPGAGEVGVRPRGGGPRVLWIENEAGDFERWGVPTEIARVTESTAEEGLYEVSTEREQGIAMVLVDGGRCRLGGEEVDVAPFLMDRFEVSTERFRNFDPEWHGRLAAEFRRPQSPAVVVSWDEATAFARWAGKVLPTTEQWEFAASWDGKRLRRFPWGDDFSRGGTGHDWQSRPHPFTADDADRSPWGVIGQGGGVREWSRDSGPKRGYRIVRGGSVVHPRGGFFRELEFSPTLFEAARSEALRRESRRNDLGFRCVVELIPLELNEPTPVSPGPRPGSSDEVLAGQSRDKL